MNNVLVNLIRAAISIPVLVVLYVLAVLLGFIFVSLVFVVCLFAVPYVICTGQDTESIDFEWPKRDK